jgi:proteasome lid subunit RPN8/RPN11
MAQFVTPRILTILMLGAGVAIWLVETAGRRRLRSRLSKAPGRRGLGRDKSASEAIVWKESVDVYKPALLPAEDVAAQVGCPPEALEGGHGTMVLVSKMATEKVREHLASDPTIELGGVLLGLAAYDDARKCHYTVVIDAARASGGKSSSVSFAFTGSSWLAIDEELRRTGNRLTIVGWYHSHPGFGVFLSGTDMHTQTHFFAEPWQIALVVDPVSGETGYFAGALGARIAEGGVVGF